MAFRTNKMPVLQEKSVSGAVATFNTALAMPLVECKTEFMCTQASGTPSPSNPLPIIGVDEVSITHNKNDNLLDNTTYEKGKYINVGGIISDSGAWSVTDYIEIVGNNLYIAYKLATDGSGGYCAAYRADYSLIETYPIIANQPLLINAPSDAKYLRLSLRTILPETWGASLYLSDIYIIDLDGTRYGGYVDVVNKLIHITDEYAISSGITPRSYSYGSGSVQFQLMMGHGNTRPRYISNMSKFITSDASDIWCGVNNTTVYWIGILDSLSMTLDEFITWIANNPLEVVYKLRDADQFDIQISDIPTLSTIIGNNTIFADTGDIDLTFKDLDIAKRGNFREVFRLPS